MLSVNVSLIRVLAATTSKFDSELVVSLKLHTEPLNRVLQLQVHHEKSFTLTRSLLGLEFDHNSISACCIIGFDFEPSRVVSCSDANQSCLGASLNLVHPSAIIQVHCDRVQENWADS